MNKPRVQTESSPQSLVHRPLLGNCGLQTWKPTAPTWAPPRCYQPAHVRIWAGVFAFRSEDHLPQRRLGPVYNADSWAPFQALNRSLGEGGATTCILGGPAHSSCGHVNVKRHRGRVCPSPRGCGSPFKTLIHKPKPSEKLTEFQRGKPLEIDFHEHVL